MPGLTLTVVPQKGVASPCINVCRMNEATGLCEGCHRSIDEIARWQAAGDDERRAILQRIAQRRPRG